jgi:hypothetical protein
MKPTNHLRFVERSKIVRHDTVNQTSITTKVNVLQQFFEHPSGNNVVGNMFEQRLGSWIDVPLENEL